MGKLTLSIDENVVERAKRYAEERGTSVSRLVETFLGILSRESGVDADMPPITRRLHGVLKGSRLSRKDHLDHLARKYR
jgi:hypothetical protein